MVATRTVPDTLDYRKAVARWEAEGYDVLGLCPECQWGIIIEKPDGFRALCTAYGQCELSVG